MIHDNKLPIYLIGYAESTVTQELFQASTVYGGDENIKNYVEIISPEDFFKIPDRKKYQYILGFNRDQPLRREINDLLNQEQLSCPGVICPLTFASNQDFESYIGRGTFIAPFCSLMMESKIGEFCLLENYCMISHYVTIGNNVHMHPGTMIAGKTIIGDDCVFNFRSTVLNGISICNGVEVGAMSTVTKNIVVPGRYVGTPARRVGDKI
jgi:acetyltransferase-like isoleucine patch superfamily enzyme